MKSAPFSLAFAFACLAIAASVLAQETRPAARQKESLDKAAVKRDATGQPDPSFLAQHEAILARKAKGPIGVIFLGDSITANWRKAPEAWKAFESHRPANFGIGGDATQHVLWRIENGELDGLEPKAVVMLLGGNNFLSPAPEIAAGVDAVLKAVQANCPDASALLIGILPRGHDPANRREPKTGDAPVPARTTRPPTPRSPSSPTATACGTSTSMTCSSTRTRSSPAT